MYIGGAMFFTDYSMSAMELAHALEERGFESVWAPEHSHIPLSRKTPFPGGGDLPKPYYDAMDPFVVLAAASQVAKRIKFGTGVLLVQQRDAIQTAKLVASIDQASQGRFLFGVGGGWNQDEMENHGTVYASRFKRMRESIEAMKEIWTKMDRFGTRRVTFFCLDGDGLGAGLPTAAVVLAVAAAADCQRRRAAVCLVRFTDLGCPVG
jgi:alkanesulfonate monooxygenase SsuD/methylene tetrahydromethanopterin reductase-like flavin-dependent oxidoreductase (luciferase family)